MKKTTFWFLPLILLLAVTIFSGCSNDANSAIDDDNSPADARGSLISFRLGATGYNADEAGATRAAGTGSEGRVLSSSSEDLGDGLEALVQVVEAPEAKAQTRAVVSTAPAGTYTILAYQNGVQKAKWVLNYASNGSYTMAEGKEEQYLPAGSYKFYVFNQYLTFSNGKIVKSFDKANKNALYYENTVVVPNMKKHTVNFTLNPAFAEMFFKVKGFSNAAFKNDMSGTLEYAASTIPSTETVDLTTQSSTSVKNAAAGSIDVGSFTANLSHNVKTSYIVTESGRYFLPGTDVTKLSFKFKSTAGGKVYGKAVAGKTLSITNAIPGNLVAGKSYTVYVTIYYSAKYLFTDGTVGTLLANKGKTPAALVVDERNRLAVSLKNTDKNVWAQKARQRNNNSYSYDYNGVKKARDAYNGEAETWDASTTFAPSRVVKATSNDFPAFKAVGSYRPTVAGKRWYMPGVGDWDRALKFFGINDAIEGYKKLGARHHNWGGDLGYQLVQILFYQADGDEFDTWYWTANTFIDGNAAAITITLNASDIVFGGANKTDYNSMTYSRPFIKY